MPKTTDVLNIFDRVRKHFNEIFLAVFIFSVFLHKQIKPLIFNTIPYIEEYLPLIIKIVAINFTALGITMIWIAITRSISNIRRSQIITVVQPPQGLVWAYNVAGFLNYVGTTAIFIFFSIWFYIPLTPYIPKINLSLILHNWLYIIVLALGVTCSIFTVFDIFLTSLGLDDNDF